MNKLQAQYAVAKAKYETVLALEAEELKKIEHLMDENEELYIEQERAIGRRLNRRELYTELRQAEDAMIEWANEKVLKSAHCTPKYKAALAETMENIWNLKIRNKMVYLAFRLA